MLPLIAYACDKCDNVYTYVMCEQYKLSNELYYTEDQYNKLLLESKLDILANLREILEEPQQ